MTRIAPDHLGRQAFVYVRQSTQDQVLHNHESRRRQYALADRARGLGWAEPVVIDDDLGRSGGGVVRPGFERLLLAICEGRAGIVLAVEASRLARNGRDWCAFHVIRPSVPRASGRAFHEHPATLVRGLRGFSSLLIASPAVKGVGGAEGCPREGPARPAPRRPGGWRCRARGRGRWASRGEGHAHCPASARLSAPVLRSDGPSRAMR